MNDPLLVRRFEGFGDLPGDGERFVDRDRPLRDAVRQRRPLDQFEDQRPDALSLFQPVDAPDVGMVSATRAPWPHARSGPAGRGLT